MRSAEWGQRSGSFSYNLNSELIDRFRQVQGLLKMAGSAFTGCAE